MRIIARLDVKSKNVIKGISFEGLRVIGDPNALLLDYVSQGADELLLIDTVASLYMRNNLVDVIKQATKSIHIPITVGGGVRNLDDITKLLNAGADKVAINTHAFEDAAFLKKAAKRFGSQCIVSSINVKSMLGVKWTPWKDNAREPTHVDLVDWINCVQESNVGEILITSIDNDGKMNGLDKSLVNTVAPLIETPLIIGGGFCGKEDVKFLENSSVDGLAVASLLHYKKSTISEIKDSFGLTFRNAQEKKVLKKFGIPKKIGIVDYGCGNLHGLLNSLKTIGITAQIVNDASTMKCLDSLILPGVGAFGHAANQLDVLGLRNAIREFANQNKPIFGICLGAQLLLDTSEEQGLNEGLKLISGDVTRIEALKCKVPNIGWRRLDEYDSSHKIFHEISSEDHFYFVHSFKMITSSPQNTLAKIVYCNQSFAAIISNRKNIFGVQFHPEKSGAAGLQMLKNFCTL